MQGAGHSRGHQAVHAFFLSLPEDLASSHKPRDPCYRTGGHFFLGPNTLIGRAPLGANDLIG